ncbi:MAG TPA: hypothetical protein VLA69_00015 [Gaiellaceae bacterium]|nr:hypothetical protein [Gaiellaceae bacterium]
MYDWLRSSEDAGEPGSDDLVILGYPRGTGHVPVSCFCRRKREVRRIPTPGLLVAINDEGLSRLAREEEGGYNFTGSMDEVRAIRIMALGA